MFKDQFLAVMSHELRTPLNAMIGFLGIIKMGGGLPEKTTYMIDRVRDNAERLLILINDILDLSKIEAKRFEIHNELVPLKDLAAIWKAQNDVLASEKGLNFNVEVDPKFPDVIYTDSDALTKIVVNLLSNAFKFTKTGEVNLAIQMRDAAMEIRVTDTGIGIAEDKQKLVFESFRQVDSSTRRSYGGTGLGLTIVRSLTHLMKGSVTLKSQPGSGSAFTVLLPLQPVPQEKSSHSHPHTNPILSK
jgi:signal transduction histidine kinase